MSRNLYRHCLIEKSRTTYKVHCDGYSEVLGFSHHRNCGSPSQIWRQVNHVYKEVSFDNLNMKWDIFPIVRDWVFISEAIISCCFDGLWMTSCNLFSGISLWYFWTSIRYWTFQRLEKRGIYDLIDSHVIFLGRVVIAPGRGVLRFGLDGVCGWSLRTHTHI